MLTSEYYHAISYMGICTHCVWCHNIQCFYFYFFHISCVFSLYCLTLMDRILYFCLTDRVSTEYNRGGKINFWEECQKVFSFGSDCLVVGRQLKKKKKLTLSKMLHYHEEILFENLFFFLVFSNLFIRKLLGHCGLYFSS